MSKPIQRKPLRLELPSEDKPKESKVEQTAQKGLASLKRSREVEMVEIAAKRIKTERPVQWERKASLDASHPQTDEESRPLQGGVLQRPARLKPDPSGAGQDERSQLERKASFDAPFPQIAVKSLSRSSKKQQRINQVMALLKEANALAWKHQKPHPELDLAIQKYSEAFSMPSDEQHKMKILLNWGLALLRRNNPAREIPFEGFDTKDIVNGTVSDADQAIARFHEGLARIDHDENLNARLRLGLGNAFLKKYELSSNPEDLKEALKGYNAGLAFPIPNEEIRAGLLKAKGIVLILLAKESFQEALTLDFDNPILQQNLERALKGLSPITDPFDRAESD